MMRTSKSKVLQNLEKDSGWSAKVSLLWNLLEGTFFAKAKSINEVMHRNNSSSGSFRLMLQKEVDSS